MIKRYGKQILCLILEWQTRRFRAKHNFTLVAVVGSVGKTSTKLAVAQVLSSSKKVRFQTGNYNDRLTVPLVIFGHQNPNIFNIMAWLKLISQNEFQIYKKVPFEAVVVELGTDAPGQIAEFEYLHPDIAVVTATTEEHMEFFGSLDAVAKEELSVADFSNQLIVNSDDVASKYRKHLKKYISYGENKSANYKIVSRSSQPSGQTVTLSAPGRTKNDKITIQLLGAQGAKVALAAYAVAHLLDVPTNVALHATEALEAFSGRMRMLDGIKNSVIIDDSYNASPAAVKAALDVVYNTDAPQKIAVLGNMNELGDTSQQLHKTMGQMCDPKQLDHVVFIGPDANKYSAPAAKSKGCTVNTFDSPYAAGEFVKSKLKEDALVLVKGSQNRVFAEEAIKSLLKNPDDMPKLVRQSDFWLNIKRTQFKDYRG